MPCSTCSSFPSPTSKFNELNVNVKNHSTLYRCSDCCHLIELIAEERTSHSISLSDALPKYFDSTFWPISVSSLYCKSCGEPIHLESAIESSPFSWPYMSTFWHVCKNCDTGNHIRVTSGQALIIEITGAPGPEWMPLSSAKVMDLDARKDPEFLHVSLKELDHSIPCRK